MEFFSPSGRPRPVRLCEATRQFAWESLNHKYGAEVQKTPFVSMDDVPGFEELPRIERYDASIRQIALKAPIRIVPGERVSGAATLGWSIRHCVPAALHEKILFTSISHLTLDFGVVLREGIDGIRRRVDESMKRFAGDEDRMAFLRSCASCLDSMAIWHRRYLEALREMPGMEENYQNLSRVPFAPAESFHEAVQSLWFTFAFTRLCGNWPGIGCIDRMLGDFLKRDLESGRLTLDEAREILAHFFIKGCEWITGEECGSGDAQHYQNLVLAGTDAEGRDVTNEVTYLVLDIISELGIGDFPTTMRINSSSSEELLRRTAETVSYGGGAVAVYNEDLILRSLKRFGYPESEIHDFANDGCWEVQIPGKTSFAYMPFDALEVLQTKTLDSYSESVQFDSFEELYRAFVADLKARVDGIFREEAEGLLRDCGGKTVWTKRTPCTIVSLFEDGCIEHGLSYLEGGTPYFVRSPHIGGLPDLVNSLYAIRMLVYREKKVTLAELMRILRDDWKDQEALRLYVYNHTKWYGNDHDDVDELAVRVLDDFASICEELDGKTPIRVPAGVSTFGRQIEWAPHRLACPFGTHAHDVLSGNLSPTPGTDTEGATAVIRSYCKAHLERQVCGAALDVRLLPQCVEGDEGIDAIAGLIRGFAALNGYFMQLDVVNNDILLRAQEHPEEYQTLSVRVSGWNARFVTLNREWQDMIIGKTEQSL